MCDINETHQYSKAMADKDESISDAVTIDTNPGNLFAHPQCRLAGLLMCPLKSAHQYIFHHWLTLKIK